MVTYAVAGPDVSAVLRSSPLLSVLFPDLCQCWLFRRLRRCLHQLSQWHRLIARGSLPDPVQTQLHLPDPHSWTRRQSADCLPTRDPSPSHSWTCHPSRGCLQTRDPSPSRTRTRHLAVTGPVTHPGDVTVSWTRQPAVSRPISRPFPDPSPVWRPSQ